MSLPNPPPYVPNNLVKDLKKCTEILEFVLKDPSVLSQLSVEERRAFLMAAGRVSRPTRLEMMKVYKSYRNIRNKKKQDADRAMRAQTEIRRSRETTHYVPPKKILPSQPLTERWLESPRPCYVCKAEFQKLHFFYDSMCEKCAEFNYSKRFQTASLSGRVALITGARLKIGYQAALMMLRAGAEVIVTTRFPQDCALRFGNESDFDDWSQRLQIHGLDLRHSPSVEFFTRYLNQRLSRLDILINNAAQTVRRPPGFYAHLMEAEMKNLSELPEKARMLLSEHAVNRQRLLSASPKDAEGAGWVSDWYKESIGVSMSAALSQIPYDFDKDAYDHLNVFPSGKLDLDQQQVDLRQMNSWRLKLADVPTPEMVEVQLVNAIAPFILCSKLKPLMLRSPERERHIVNVSAMEGKFLRFTKTDRHPHTNMAKAALNMMTLTSASDYARDGIFMNAVDTGWVTDEDPHHLSVRKQEQHDFQPPLDIVDGAARVCDPIFSGLLTGENVYGKFLKDYMPTDW